MKTMLKLLTLLKIHKLKSIQGLAGKVLCRVSGSNQQETGKLYIELGEREHQLNAFKSSGLKTRKSAKQNVSEE